MTTIKEFTEFVKLVIRSIAASYRYVYKIKRADAERQKAFVRVLDYLSTVAGETSASRMAQAHIQMIANKNGDPTNYDSLTEVVSKAAELCEGKPTGLSAFGERLTPTVQMTLSA